MQYYPEQKPLGTLITIPENLSREWVEKNYSRIHTPSAAITLDFTKTRSIDSSGLSMVHLLRKRYEKAGIGFSVSHVSGNIESSLQNWKLFDRPEPLKKRVPLLLSLGDTAYVWQEQVLDALSMLAETLYWGTWGLFKSRHFRKGVLGEQMYQLGFKAIIIVMLLSFLVGIVLSIQTADQLRVFGAEIYLVALIVMSMVREIGPLMTAIVLAGRSGSATTAEIATMGVQEEIDALRTMGLNPIQFIVVPKFWAITLTMPILSMLSVAAGIFGGFVVAIFYVDLSPSLFWNKVEQNLLLDDFLAGFIKSIVFSWLIIWIGSFYGFKVKGGAEEVGKETTAAVVTAIFVIIIADALFSFIL
jgi:phospholipid/cholesterol/gamma-HCH transport system permease protein